MEYKEDTMEIREYMEEDLFYMKRNLREADRKELEALFDEPFEKGLDRSIGESDEVWVATEDGLPWMLFGLSDVSSEKSKEKVGIIWAVGTDRSTQLVRELYSFTERVLDIWFERFDVLQNWIWEDSISHQNWLRNLGFVIFEEEYEVSPAEEKFFYFAKWSDQRLDDIK